MRRGVLATLLGLLLFFASLLVVVFAVRPNGDSVGVAFVLAMLLVSVGLIPVSIYARRSRRQLHWFTWFAEPKLRFEWSPWHFWLTNTIIGVAIPIEFIVGNIGRPLPLWFRIAAVCAVGAVGVALTANLVYELTHGVNNRRGHLRRS